MNRFCWKSIFSRWIIRTAAFVLERAERWDSPDSPDSRHPEAGPPEMKVPGKKVPGRKVPEVKNPKVKNPEVKNPETADLSAGNPVKGPAGNATGNAAGSTTGSTAGNGAGNATESPAGRAAGNAAGNPDGYAPAEDFFPEESGAGLLPCQFRERREDVLEQISRRVEVCVVRDKIFLDPDLTMEKLAAEVGSNRTYLSRALSRYKGMHFNGYINACRLRHAAGLLEEGGAGDALDMALLSGFRSVKTFRRALQDSAEEDLLYLKKRYICKNNE